VTSADQEQGDLLNNYLDDRVRGLAPLPLEPATAEAVEQFFGHDDAPPPHGELANKIWEEMMSEATISGTMPIAPSFAPKLNQNGFAPPRGRLLPVTPGLGQAQHRRWAFIPLALVALLLLALGAGYRAFDPFGSGSGQPASVPAAIAPAAAPAAAASIPREDHPIIGVWLLDYEPWTPGKQTSYVLFDENGTYIEYHGPTGIWIGTWRATGPNSAEAVSVAQQPITLEDFEAGFAIPPSMFGEGRVITGYMAFEVAEGGTSLTGDGYYEPRNPDGSVAVHIFYEQRDGKPFTAVPGTRLAPVLLPEATPAP